MKVQQKNYYDALGVDPRAQAQEVERAYRALLAQFMAGTPPPPPEGLSSQEQLLLIQEAYHTLSKPERRLEYDRQETGRLKSHMPASAAAEAPGDKNQRRNVYRDYFGFAEKPFDLTPDPKYLYLSPKHKEVLAHLLYGMQENSGFLKIIGEVGTGKTTLCRSFLRQLQESFKIAYIFNPWVTALELLQAINREFGLPCSGASKLELMETLNEFLLREKRLGHRVVVIIDEAQDLDPTVLEQLRLISNLETDREKLIQIVLIGQPELDKLLSTDQLRQLRQRITIQWELLPLNLDESRCYIQHRLNVAMGRGKVLFTRMATRWIYYYAQGIPRMINVVADRALLIAYTRNTKRVSERIVHLAAKDVGGLKNPFAPLARLVKRVLLPTAMVAALFWYVPRMMWQQGVAPEASRVAPVAPPPVSAKPPESAPLPSPAAEETKTAAVKPPEPAGPDTAKASAPAGAPSAKVRSASDAPLMFAQTQTLVTYLSSLSLAESKVEAAKWVLKEWNAPQAKIDALGENSLAPQALDSEFELETYEANGNLDRLVVFNYPLILELILPDLQGTKYLALLAVRGDRGVFGSADKIEMPLSLIDPLWNRKAVILWRDFEHLPQNFEPGYQGRETVWLQKNLRLLGFFKGREAPVYGAKTVEAVLGFQRQHNIRDDGKFSAESRILLYRLLNVYETPKLKKES